MNKKKRILTVYALMHVAASDGHQSLCAIFSTKKRAAAFADKLKRKMIQREDSYIVDAWHVNGAHDS